MFNALFDTGRSDALPYARPILQVYGDVKVLTASGTGIVAENGNQPNCSTNAGKKPC